jgi:Fe-S-cluster-containing dehydrogenase component
MWIQRDSGPNLEERKAMSWIVTRLCRDCMDTACVSVCPVDCIYRYQAEDNARLPSQLFHKSQRVH